MRQIAQAYSVKSDTLGRIIRLRANQLRDIDVVGGRGDINFEEGYLPPMKAEPHLVDVEVGKRIRVQRTLRKMSQTELGNRIGVTFQQVQKYERGSNRVSASKLVEIANALDVDVRLFFENLHNETQKQPSLAGSLMGSRQAALLNAAFFAIADERIRDNILRLVQAIAGPGSEV